MKQLSLLFVGAIVSTAVHATLTRNPFAPLPKQHPLGHLATACWHDHHKEATLIKRNDKICIRYEKKPLQLGKAEGLGG